MQSTIFSNTADLQKQNTLTTGAILPSIYYSEDEYMFSQAMYFAGFIIVVLAILICLIGIFSPHKLAGLEIMFVIQYTFLSFVFVDYFLFLPYYCVGFPLQFSVGYHEPLVQATQVDSPPQAYTFNLHATYFYANFNFFQLTYALSLIGWIISLVVLKNTEDKNNISLADRAHELFYELLMYVTMFNLSYLTFCLVVYYSFGNLTDAGSEVAATIPTVFTLAIFVWFFIKPEEFYRFRLSFKATTLTFYHYYLHITCLTSSILLLVLLPNYPWAPFVPQGLLLFYTLINKPYQFLSENLRSLFNLLVMCVVTSFRVYIFYIDESDWRSMKSFIYGAVVELCLLLIVVWAYVVVFKDFYRWYYLRQQKKKNLVFSLFDEQETIRKVERTALNSSLFRHTDILNSFRITQIDNSEQAEIKKKERKRQEREENFKEKQEPTPMEAELLE